MKNKLVVYTVLAACISWIFSINNVKAEIKETRILEEDKNQIQKVKSDELYSIPENDIKIYHMNNKDVVAIPIDLILKTSSVGDVKAFTIKPLYKNKNSNGSSEITILNTKLSNSAKKALEPPNKIKGNFVSSISVIQWKEDKVNFKINIKENTKIKVFTTKSRYINQEDGTTKFRTYIVFNASDKDKSDSKLVVIDPGHGGKDPGAIDNFMYEEKLNLDIGLRLNKLFLQNGYSTYMTRTADISTTLQDRSDAANILKADLFISIHNNSVPLDLSKDAVKIYRGTTVLYNSNSPSQKSKEIAVKLLKDITSALHTNMSPVQDRGNLRVLNSTWGPAVLVEIAMMCDNSDARMISNRIYRQRAAEAIYNSVNNYFINLN